MKVILSFLFFFSTYVWANEPASTCVINCGSSFNEKFLEYIPLVLVTILVAYFVWNSLTREKRLKEKEKRLKEKEKKNNEAYFNQLKIEATEDDNMSSMLSLAEEYFNGSIVEKNYVDALYWVLKSEALGSADAPQLRKKIEKVASDIHKKSALEKLKGFKNNNVINNNIDGGNVYIFTCSRWGASVKIGKTNNLNRRLEEAQEEVKGTYSPRPPKVEIFFSQFSDKYSELETLVHSKLDAYRVEHSGKGREFFDIAPEEARKVIIETNKGIEKI
jgi:predicted GIY-YIG superfamily endonuclease